MPDLRSLPRTRYGGIQTSSRPRIKYGVNSSWEPSQRLDPGFHREPWIPAFAGMTTFLEIVSLRTDSNSTRDSDTVTEGGGDKGFV